MNPAKENTPNHQKPISLDTIMTVRSIEPKLLTSSHHARGKPLWHVGQANTLTYCVSGLSVVYVNGQYHLFRPGQMMFSAKGTQRGRTPLSEELTLYEIILTGEINGDDIIDFFNLTEGNCVVDVPQANRHLTQLCYEKILARDVSPEAYLFRAASAIELFGIYCDARTQMEKSENMFSPVLTYMHENLDTGVTLPDLADLVHMQPTYFIRMFKKLFGQAPVAYYNTLRITSAIEFLSATSLPLSAVAKKIGMSDPYHFSTFFKNHCGISPNQYREAIRGVKSQMEAES